MEVGLAATSSCWWAFNLVFSMTFIHLAGHSTPIGLPGLCAIHAVVACLLYAFILQALPPCAKVHNLSLCQIERYFDKKYNPPHNHEGYNNSPEINHSASAIELHDNDLNSTTSITDERHSRQIT